MSIFYKLNMEYFPIKDRNSSINQRKNKEYSPSPSQATNIEGRERWDLISSSIFANRWSSVQSHVFKCHFSDPHFYLWLAFFPEFEMWIYRFPVNSSPWMSDRISKFTFPELKALSPASPLLFKTCFSNNGSFIFPTAQAKILRLILDLSVSLTSYKQSVCKSGLYICHILSYHKRKSLLFTCTDSAMNMLPTL